MLLAMNLDSINSILHDLNPALEHGNLQESKVGHRDIVKVDSEIMLSNYPT